MKKKLVLHTLGCKLNFAESSSIENELLKNGWDMAENEDVVDMYVINTCSVTENANKECRSLIRKMKRKSPDARVVITGCYAQLQPEEIAEIPGVDKVIGGDKKFDISEYLKDENGRHSCEISQVQEFSPASSLGSRTRSFLKVQDGCDYPCTYCTIPMARGKSRSPSIDTICQQANELAANGVKEIVLTGVNIGDFGKKNGKSGSEDFLGLIEALDKIEGIERYRISSIEPNLLSPEIIDFVARSEKFMPHFHIPLQSGSDRILGLMKRRYRKDLYKKRIEYIREKIPEAGIGVDVIVGFPTESEDDFAETYDFLDSLSVSYLHVFTYSERPDTEALELTPIVPVHVRRERNRILRELSESKQQKFAFSNRNTRHPVLFEHGDDQDEMQGYTDNYIRIKIPYNAEWANKVVDWVL